jgi:hypothetical protein
MTSPVTPLSLPRYAGAQKLTRARVIRAEWTKLRSLPSAGWCLLLSTAAIIGVGILSSLLRAARPPHGAAAVAALDPTAVSLSGVEIAMFVTGVLGLLFMTGEYGTGQVRSTFTAVPGRLPVLWGKTVVLAGAVFTMNAAAGVIAFLIGQSILDGHHLGTSLGQPGTVRAVLGGAVFLTAVTLLGLGLGTLARNTAGACGALFGILFALPLVVSFLPGSMSETLSKYMPGEAGMAILNTVPVPANLSPVPGLGLFIGYAAVVLALAAWRIRRQEA